MSLVYRKRANAPSLTHWIHDFRGELSSFATRIDRKRDWVPLVLLKSIEWGIYRWYQTPIRRFYGVKGNELIYMITRRCTDRCAKCGIWRTPETDSEHLPVAKFIDCLRRLHENLYQLTITGGEPLVYAEDVLAIGEVARELDVPMLVVTNGAPITRSFLQQYAAMGHLLVVSLDTLDETKWARFRGRHNFDRVLRNVALAHSLLGGRLRIQSVLALESRAEVFRVTEYCRQKGIPHAIQPYMDFGGNWHSAGEYGDRGVHCAARKNICIYPNGDVVKCFDHRRIPIAAEPLGNIAEEDIITILCKRRATEVSRVMKTCDFPCKQLTCNLPVAVDAQ